MTTSIIRRILYNTATASSLSASGLSTLFKGVNGNYFVFIDDPRIATDDEKFRAYNGEQALEFMKKHATVGQTNVEFGVADA